MEEIKTYKLEDISVGKGCYGIAASAIPYSHNKRTYLRITDINDDGSINLSGLMSVEDENADKFLLNPNDIVFARTGNSTGRSYFYDGSVGPLVYAGFLIKFSLDKTKVNPRILKYYTHSQKYYDWVHSFDTGGTRGNINAKTYGEMPIDLPPIETQNRIVSILKSLDDKIELNKRINDNLEQQVQIMFDQHLVNNTATEFCRLSDIANINPKRTLSKNTKARYIEMSDLPTKGSFPSGWKYKEFIGGMKFTNCDTIMARITPCLENGKVAYINFLDKGEVAFGSTEYIVISTKGLYSPEWFYFLTRNKTFVDYSIKHMNGSSGRQRVSGESIGDFQLPLFSKDSLKPIFSMAESALKIITRNSLENIELSAIRDSILPKLMSGELKVNDLNN